MNTIYETIDILKNKNKTKISIFCGAGISVRSGLPSASMLLEYILKSLSIEKPDIEALKYSDGSWIMPFESFMNAFIEHDKNIKLFDIFKLGKPNRNHFFINELAINARLNEIYTTNFDNLIERMFETVKKLKFKVILENNINIFNNQENDFVSIIKLHGTIDDANTIKSTIFSITSETGLENRKKLIERAFNSESDILLFWGYSFSDILDITPIMELTQIKKKKLIIIIQHNPNIKEIGKAIIVPLYQSHKQHPLRKFNGYSIQVDADLLIQNILGREHNYIEAPINKREWQNIVESWINSFENVHIKYSILCHLFYDTAQYELALKYNEIIIQLNKCKSNKGKASALSNRGLILFELERLTEALKCFRSAYKIFNKINFEFGVATCYNSIGGVYAQMRCFKNSMKYLQKGLDYIEEKKFKEGNLCKGYLLKNIGELKIMEKDFLTAEESFNAALDIFKHGYKAEEAEILMFKGKLYRLIGKIDESNKLFNNAISLAKKIGYYQVINKCNTILSNFKND